MKTKLKRKLPNIYQLSGKTTWGKIISDHSEPGILGGYPQDKKKSHCIQWVCVCENVGKIDKANTFM